MDPAGPSALNSGENVESVDDGLPTSSADRVDVRASRTTKLLSAAD